ncbi:hypothetical protein FGO68_gene14966 [Halteria grandinella]|uniref:Leucine Rich Repeat family protein n=1 Tax=Halteria grandinella TaxID=5974 RepID=A0A8J8T9J7_HALGN|nr:hypothetical protein FGO68_gene14966 [Halteria grandinella]
MTSNAASLISNIESITKAKTSKIQFLGSLERIIEQDITHASKNVSNLSLDLQRISRNTILLHSRQKSGDPLSNSRLTFLKSRESRQPFTNIRLDSRHSQEGKRDFQLYFGSSQMQNKSVLQSRGSCNRNRSYLKSRESQGLGSITSASLIEEEQLAQRQNSVDLDDEAGKDEIDKAKKKREGQKIKIKDLIVQSNDQTSPKHVFQREDFLKSLLLQSKPQSGPMTILQDYQPQKHINQPEEALVEHLLEFKDRQVLLQSSITKANTNQGLMNFPGAYAKECDKHMVNPLPTLVSKGQKKFLQLYNYPINSGTIKGLCKSLSKCKDGDQVEMISLSANTLTDTDFSHLIEALKAGKHPLSVIQYSRNQLGIDSIFSLINILNSKGQDSNIEKLQLYKLHIQSSHMTKLIASFSIQQSHLQHLTLSRCNIQDTQLNALISFLEFTSPKLTHLDLSFNKLTPSGLATLFRSLEPNERLQFLNIAGTPVKNYFPLDSLISLCKFIVNDSMLLHIDLTDIFATNTQLKMVIKAVSMSVSLQCVHIGQSSNNMAVPKQYLESMLQIRMDTPEQKRIEDRSIEKEQKSTDQEEWREKYFEVMTRNLRSQQFASYKNFQAQHAQDLVLTRVLGHPEITNSAPWRIFDSCLMCERWIYSLIFTQGSKTNFEDHQDFNTTSQTFTNNSDFMKLEDFLKILDPKHFRGPLQIYGDYLATLNEADLQKHQKSDRLVKKKILDCYHKANLQYNWDTLSNEYLRFFHSQILPTNFKTQCPSLFSPDYDIYVHATFIKPTLLTETLTLKQNTSSPSVFSFQPQIRSEDFEPLGSHVKNVVLKENTAFVFGEWKKDTQATYQKMLELDFSYWKVPRMFKNNQVSIRAVEEVIEVNIVRLNELFISLISVASNYPFITWLDFCKWITQIKIVDDNTLPMSTFDRMFIAVNIEEEDLEDNPDRALCRYEFWEILVRIAVARYEKIPQGVALQQFLNEYVFKYSQISDWAGFRDEMWRNNLVNLTLQAHLDPLRQLHKTFFTQTKPYMSYQNAVALFTFFLKGFVTYKEATLCYGLSKMTLEKDFSAEGGGYKKLEFVEFLEYIVRVAHAKYSQQSPRMVLLEKVEKVLDLLLPMVNQTRREIQRYIEVKKEFTWGPEDEDGFIIAQEPQKESQNVQENVGCGILTERQLKAEKKRESLERTMQGGDFLYSFERVKRPQVNQSKSVDKGKAKASKKKK